MSVDPSGVCPLTKDGVPCLECYVEAPRVQNQISMEVGASGTGSKPAGTKMKPNENWAKASKAYDSAPYNGEILGMPSVLVDFLNERMGGLRMFSSGDFRPEDIPVINRIMKDAAAKRLYIKVITKQPKFVELYGDLPHVRLNLSTDFLPEHAAELSHGDPKLEALISDPAGNKLISNGFRIETAEALKERYRNVRTRYVAMNGEDGIKAVADPRLDVVTMYHGAPGEGGSKLVELWERMRLDLRKNLGPDTVKSLAQSFKDTDVPSWIRGVTQQQIDAVLGPGKMTKAAWDKLAQEKVCCQTGKCATSGAQCGFKVHDPQDDLPLFSPRPIRVVGKGGSNGQTN